MSKILKIPDEIKPSLNPYYTGSTLWVSGATIEVEAEVKVLILIILEVLYEKAQRIGKKRRKRSLNPYYTGSTLWELSL